MTFFSLQIRDALQEYFFVFFSVFFAWAHAATRPRQPFFCYYVINTSSLDVNIPADKQAESNEDDRALNMLYKLKDYNFEIRTMVQWILIIIH